MKPCSLFLLVMSALTGLAQVNTNPPAIAWQRVIPGSCDRLIRLKPTPEGGFILGGTFFWRAETEPDTPGFGGGDYGVVRLDAQGNVLWKRVYGGTDLDWFTVLEPTGDGGYILGGCSKSEPGGNKTSPFYGGDNFDGDFWVVRIDSEGTILWDRSFGGAQPDVLRSIVVTDDGGFLLGGYSVFPVNQPNYYGEQADYRVIKLDARGNVLWNRTYGGDRHDRLTCMAKTAEGNYLLAGDSFGYASGDKTVAWPWSPVASKPWVLWIDAAGNLLKQRLYAATQRPVWSEELPLAVSPTADGGFLLAGYCTGDGSTIGWVARIDAQGNQLWDRASSLSQGSGFHSAEVLPDDGFILGGTYQNDYWGVRLDKAGTKLWERTLGGNDYEALGGLAMASDGGVVLAGLSMSDIGGSKTVPRSIASQDAWLVKLQPDIVHLRLNAAPPQPGQHTTNGLHLTLTGPPQTYVLDYSADCSTWIPLQTNELVTGPWELFDPVNVDAPRRFYRARATP